MVFLSRVFYHAISGSSKRIIPMLDRVAIEKMAPDTTTKSGILLPTKVKKGEIYQGTVVAVGEGGRNDKGELIPMNVKLGDSVIVPEGDCFKMEFDQDKREYYIYREKDIICKVV